MSECNFEQNFYFRFWWSVYLEQEEIIDLLRKRPPCSDWLISAKLFSASADKIRAGLRVGRTPRDR